MAMLGDETRDPVTGRTLTVVWSGEADRREACFSLVGNIEQSKFAKEDQTRGATYDTGHGMNVRARNWGPVRNGRLYA